MKTDTRVADATLIDSLRPAAVDLARLNQEYGPLLQIVRLLIGVVPNCDSYLAIWPAGFRSYNLLVPNLLNLPFSVWGFGPPSTTLGLAMCAASRTAQCAYCTAHTCSFTLRRGSAPAKLAGDLNPAELAAVEAGEALARVPCTFRAEHREALRRHFPAMDAERIALGIGMIGFLNKFMDAVGIDLEEAAVAEVSPVLLAGGWTPGKHRVCSIAPEDPRLLPRAAGRDTLLTKLALLRHVPAAIRLESSWTRGVPARWPAVGTWLREHTGHDFPLLAKLESRRAVRAIATVLRDNLNAAGSRLGLRLKALAGLVYATVARNETLAREARLLAARTDPALPENVLDAIARFAAEPADPGDSALAAGLARLTTLPGLGDEAALVLLLAKAISPSPAAVSEPLAELAGRTLSPEAMIELVVWISVQQMLHRLGCYVGATT